jgi:hypothetical protein
MILRLSDSGKAQRTLYDARTKTIYFVNDDVLPLSSKSSRKAKKEAREKGKAERTEARQAKRTKRSQEKTARKNSSQERRTDRRVQKQARKSNKRAVKVAKQNKKLVKVTGRTAVIQARNQQKLQNIMNQNPYGQEDYSAEDYQDQSFAPSPADVDYSDIDYSTPNYYEDTEDVDYELVPEEEELSAGGLIGTAANALKGAVKGVINQGKEKVSTAVKSKIPANNETIQLRAKVKEQESKIDAANQRALYIGIGGTVAGALIGAMIFKK